MRFFQIHENNSTQKLIFAKIILIPAKTYPFKVFLIEIFEEKVLQESIYANRMRGKFIQGQGGREKRYGVIGSNNAFFKTLFVFGQFSKRYYFMKNLVVMRYSQDIMAFWRYLFTRYMHYCCFLQRYEVIGAPFDFDF